MSRYDVFDQNNQPTGKIASYDEVYKKGLWHRGVHVIIYTPEKQIVMQKRSISLKCHPGEIEISVGGGVDAGEKPEDAILREIKEEIGITVEKDELRFIGITKYNHRSKNQISRSHIYNFSLCIDKDQLGAMLRDKSEVDELFFISKPRLQRALTIHRIKNVGKIAGQYAYWKMLLRAI